VSILARLPWLAALLLLPSLPAGDLRDHPTLRTVRSTSGQFLVGVPADLSGSPSRSTNSAHVELSPHTLVVSCERIKQTLLRELGLPDYWFHPIHVLVNPTMASGEPPVIGVRLLSNGWQYRVDVPRWIESQKLVRGIVQVLFLELANRTAGSRSAEIPLWLTEGFSQHLVASSTADLVVGHPSLTINGVQVRWQNRPPAVREPLRAVRERLQEYAAFSFTRMGEIDPTQLSEETWKTFQASSHLLVNQLLTLPNARAQLGAMLAQLPHHLNWQIAFLNAFHQQFPRMLDVEKWWSVVLVHFSGLDSANAWSLEVALHKIHQTINPPVLISQNPQELPRRANLRLQDIIDRFDYLRQRILLQDVIRQLRFLRTLTPPSAVPLLDEYRRTLEDYLERRDRAGTARSLPGLPPMNSDRLVHEIIDKLDSLDQYRAELAARPTQASTATAP
jgi:hypothetical protein